MSTRTRPYRYKHLPTGLYYCPCTPRKLVLTFPSGKKSAQYVKSNLSKTGKAYYGNSWKAHNQGPVGGFENHVDLAARLQRLVDERAMEDWNYLPSSWLKTGFCPYVAADWEVEFI